MKQHLTLRGQRLALVVVLLPLLGLFLYTALRAGPLAAIDVTVTNVESADIAPALFGIGTIEARYRYRIGPVVPGRLLRLDVQPGDRVRAGEVVGEMDPVDFDERLRALDAAVQRADAAVTLARAQQEEARARAAFAGAQAARYAQLLDQKLVSADAMDARNQERDMALAAQQAALAGLDAARADQARLAAERVALRRQRENLKLVAPVDGLVSRRDADPGTTLVAGQAAVEIIDPQSIWLEARFDQQGAAGLAAGLSAQIELRSRPGERMNARVARVEPRADAATEELIAMVDLTPLPEPLPPVGELAEVTVQLAMLPPRPLIPGAALRRVDGRDGVWRLDDDDTLRFVPVRAGRGDLDGRLQILEGLQGGERIIVHSNRSVGAGSRVRVVEQLAGTPR
jgi:RND family efflux transporter MFP subunit